MNTYSTRWFDIFLATVPAAQTAREMDFLARHLFPPARKTVLDVACGLGRHTRELSALGFAVTGMDASEYALENARRTDPHTRYLSGDMRELDALLPRAERFDAVLSLNASFGYFDADTNARVLEQIARRLKTRGRFILDVYNREFFETRQGGRLVERAGQTLWETRELRGERLHVELEYGDAREIFEWQIFTPDALAAFVAPRGFDEMLCCANFDENIAPGAEYARMQFIFQKAD